MSIWPAIATPVIPPAPENSWTSVCWAASLGRLVAVAGSGGSSHVMYSDDAVTWTVSTSGVPNVAWASVCWADTLGADGRGRFVAVAGASPT